MRSSEAGFSLAETLVATAVMMTVSSVVTSAILQMTKSQATISNRTQMHSGVRGATELLQQEVGQAGRVTLPAGITLNANVALAARTITLTSTNGVFAGELLTVDTGSMAACTANCPETVKVFSVDTATQLTVDNQLSLWLGEATPGLKYSHLSGAPVTVLGGFSAGVVPDNYPTSPSTGYKLKLFGDINSDGNMVYVEYFCDPKADGKGNLYRTMVTLPASALTVDVPPKVPQVLLSNLKTNPPDNAPAPCFTYQKPTAVAGNTYVTDVAITLTVQTQQPDPVTKQYQWETKALLNVSPRNVVNTWQFASTGGTDRVQPMPPVVAALTP